MYIIIQISFVLIEFYVFVCFYVYMICIYLLLVGAGVPPIGLIGIQQMVERQGLARSKISQHPSHILKATSSDLKPL